MMLQKHANALLVVVEVAKMLNLGDRQHGSMASKSSNESDALQFSIKFDFFLIPVKNLQLSSSSSSSCQWLRDTQLLT